MYIFFRIKWYQLTRFFDGLAILQCANCGRWLFASRATYKQMTTGFAAPLCRKCLWNLYKEEK